MARPRNLPIDIAVGVSKEVEIIFSDKPDLRAAEVNMYIKRHAGDSNFILCKPMDLEKSDLENGKAYFTFVPDDTKNLPSRTYIYEVKVIYGEGIYVPLIGDWNLFDTIA